MRARILPVSRAGGFTLLELLFCSSLIVTLAAMAVPLTGGTLDAVRTAMAARYLQARIMEARMDALRRSTCVAIRFEARGPDYAFRQYVDGNGNGIRTADIRTGLDLPLTSEERLDHRFPGVRFGLVPGTPDADGSRSSALDGLRLGTAGILTSTPDGLSSSGTLYVRGRRSQYAVRVLGGTGRTRVLRYDARTETWVPQ